MMTTAVRKLEEKFLLPLLQQARADPRTASNAVNKVRDLKVSAATGAGLGYRHSHITDHIQ